MVLSSLLPLNEFTDTTKAHANGRELSPFKQRNSPSKAGGALEEHVQLVEAGKELQEPEDAEQADAADDADHPERLLLLFLM